jgi:VCBS repeat-containing protein
VVTSPTNNSSFTSPVHVTATASSSAPITCIKIYVDGVVKYSVNNVSKIDAWVKMAKGTRRITVQSWDSLGTVYKSTVYVNVN